MNKHYALNVTNMTHNQAMREITLKQWTQAHLERQPSHVMLVIQEDQT